ncbi:MAG: hypothetical protein P8M80_07875 [Pirellulaceae bacterium]|nr:hypothetical protein [Pirellulaceae bacterium]
MLFEKKDFWMLMIGNGFENCKSHRWPIHKLDETYHVKERQYGVYVTRSKKGPLNFHNEFVKKKWKIDMRGWIAYPKDDPNGDRTTHWCINNDYGLQLGNAVERDFSEPPTRHVIDRLLDINLTATKIEKILRDFEDDEHFINDYHGAFVYKLNSELCRMHDLGFLQSHDSIGA